MTDFTIAEAAHVAASTPGSDTAVHGAMQLDITTVIALVGVVISIGTILWKMASDSATRKAFEAHMVERDREIKEYRASQERLVETQFTALNAANTLLREQLGEVRENIAKNYMTKPEINAIESRVTAGQDRIFTTLERIDGRLGKLSERVGALSQGKGKVDE